MTIVRKLPAFFTLSAALALASSVFGATAAQKLTIQKLTSIFENSTTSLQYTYCENIGDGRGLTFGFPGFCSGTYDGTMFLKEYQKLNSSNKLVKYIPAFEKIDSLPHPGGKTNNTTGLSNFPKDFKSCGSDPTFKKAQHNLVDRLYWNPSQNKANSLGLKLAISQGQMYDSFINHGASGAQSIINKTNSQMGGSPASGVNEKAWLTKYLSNRFNVLKADPTWAEAVDRVRVYQTLLKNNNTSLATPFSVSCYGDQFTVN